MGETDKEEEEFYDIQLLNEKTTTWYLGYLKEVKKSN